MVTIKMRAPKLRGDGGMKPTKIDAIIELCMVTLELHEMCGGRLITCNLNMQKYDYKCKLRHKTFHFYACYHTLSAFITIHTILSYNIKIHYIRDNYA